MVRASDKSLLEFLFHEYPDEQSAVDYLTAKRWGGNITCPYCQGSRVGKGSKSQPHRCYPCDRKFSVKTGTFMHNSPIPVRAWLLTMFFMAKSRTGVSSLWLSKQLRITQKSTWYMGHRIRRACSEHYGALLGEVEVDETHVGGLEGNKHANKKNKAKKTIVIGAKERGGRAVAKMINFADRSTMYGFIRANVLAGSSVYTDSHTGYYGIGKYGYRHETVNHSAGEYVRGNVHTNTIESFWALVKRSIKGTYTHVSPQYLQQYLDEITFRENTDDFIARVCQNA